MKQQFETIDEAFLALADPTSPTWAHAFRMLASNPETAGLMLETFRETLEQMGVEPSGADPVTGEPEFNLNDVARAMGVPEASLEIAVQESQVEPKSG